MLRLECSVVVRLSTCLVAYGLPLLELTLWGIVAVCGVCRQEGIGVLIGLYALCCRAEVILAVVWVL